MGSISGTRNGVLVASDSGVATSYSIANAQERAQTLIEPQTPVYEGMLVGLNSRPEDMAVNIVREKKQTNIRSSTSEIAVKLSPPLRLSLEQALDFIEGDELVEVTPVGLSAPQALAVGERSGARGEAGPVIVKTTRSTPYLPGSSARRASRSRRWASAARGSGGEPMDRSTKTPGCEAIVAAIDAGVRLIDTASVYVDGVAEVVVGRALRERPELAGSIVVETKVRDVRDFLYTGDETRRSVDTSLRRLGLDSIPMVFIHDPAAGVFDRVMGPDGALAALRKLQSEGVVGHVGIASNNPWDNTPYIESGEFEAAVVPDAYSLHQSRCAGAHVPRRRALRHGCRGGDATRARPAGHGHAGASAGGPHQPSVLARGAFSSRLDRSALCAARRQPVGGGASVCASAPRGQHDDPRRAPTRAGDRQCSGDASSRSQTRSGSSSSRW